MTDAFGRRALLKGLGGAGLLAGAGLGMPAGAMMGAPALPPSPWVPGFGALKPFTLAQDRIVAINVCTRPFRAVGPRIEREALAGKTVIHNYGHGGSGWSLSWGSAAEALALVPTAAPAPLAIVGCGAIGLTTALLAQRRGYAVTIYAKERPPYVRSSYATGVWSPDSRICTAEHGDAFAPQWLRMARASHRRFQTFLGQPGDPIEYTTMFEMADTPFTEVGAHGSLNEPAYPHFSQDLAPELAPAPRTLAKGHPFPAAHVRQRSLMLFNISSYSRLLLDDFEGRGGRIVTAELAGPEDFARLDAPVVVNCTGYGARRLLGDETLTPVRGQTAKLIPEQGLNYGLRSREAKASVYPRRDGLLVQTAGETDFGDDSEALRPEESYGAVARLAALAGALHRA